MVRPTIIATFFIAACAISTGAIGQKVYRCGNTYSQTPCGEGETKTLDTGPGTANNAEARARKKATDQQTKRDTKTANTLEKERLAREAAEGKMAQAQRKALEKAQAAERSAARAQSRQAKNGSASTPGSGSSAGAGAGAAASEGAGTEAGAKQRKKIKGKEPEFFTAKEAAPAKP
jgi:hypothetical protein